MKALYKYLAKEEQHSPKKFWRVDIECPDFIWRGYCSQRPSFKILFVIWAYEEHEAELMLKKCSSDFYINVWQQRLNVARQLMKHFARFQKETKVLPDVVDAFTIEVQQEVIF